MATTTSEQTTIERPQQPEYVEESPRYTPLVDVLETNEALIFKADLPGVRAEDLSVQFDKGVLSIEAKVRPRGPGTREYLCREYGIGNYSRSFDVNIPINAAEVRASLKQGELTLYVPKAESARTRQIPVQTA